ncbi:MAG: toprim domain-containing protein [Bacteroidales bacterium]|jgi:topoisomerase-4 subunit B|nr:toprim domain-containing protein [Bacteroidales bacterium]MCI2145450.1 toprim domain-containing protein [Bacteroidales bacterium]
MQDGTEKKAGEENYGEQNVITLSWNEHIRQRPGMYIGKLGDGTSEDDGIYVLIKEVIDNSVDEFGEGYGKNIIINIEDRTVTVRDYGRGIPLGKVVECASVMNTGGKFDNRAFHKAVGLNGVGIKAVNALSSDFYIQSFREGITTRAEFSKGELLSQRSNESTGEKNGTLIRFVADDSLFTDYQYNFDYIERRLRDYSYLNPGLSLVLNGKEFSSKDGLLDLLNDKLGDDNALYPPIHLKGDDIEIALTHGRNYGEEIYSFVNGQNTTQGGTHLSAFREAVAKEFKDFFKKDFDPADSRESIVAAVSVKVEDPIFESQTKTKLGSREMYKDGPSVRNYVVDFVTRELDNYLHKNLDVADIILKKIQESENIRKSNVATSKAIRERAKRTSLHNKKLRDCNIHYNDKNPLAEETTIFLTEGDSASGSITTSRDADTQAVFSLRGKPANCFKASKKKIVYENEEFNLLIAALNIGEDLDNLRYNKVVIATDADVDGMHIRLLLLTFFLKFFPELVRKGHVYILQTPLFRVQSKKDNVYCYNSAEKDVAVKKIGADAEITRFKGLGEISPSEFRGFIGKDMHLDLVKLYPDDSVNELMEFYMGDNTPDRQNFIRTYLRTEVENTEEENI